MTLFVVVFEVALPGRCQKFSTFSIFLASSRAKLRKLKKPAKDHINVILLKVNIFCSNPKNFDSKMMVSHKLYRIVVPHLDYHPEFL